MHADLPQPQTRQLVSGGTPGLCHGSQFRNPDVVGVEAVATVGASGVEDRCLGVEHVRAAGTTDITAELPDLEPEDVAEAFRFAAEAARKRQLPVRQTG